MPMVARFEIDLPFSYTRSRNSGIAARISRVVGSRRNRNRLHGVDLLPLTFPLQRVASDQWMTRVSSEKYARQPMRTSPR